MDGEWRISPYIQAWRCTNVVIVSTMVATFISILLFGLSTEVDMKSVCIVTFINLFLLSMMFVSNYSAMFEWFLKRIEKETGLKVDTSDVDF
jgi:hypothetical protein